jgi:Zn-dependent protease
MFSKTEVRDILVAWIVLSFAFVVWGRNGNVAFVLGQIATSLSLSPLVLGFVIAAGTLGAGFVLHELSHKFVAQRYGYWAEFRMWPYGLLLVLVGAVIGFFFAAPGATYISGSSIREKETGVISLAGPLTNVALAIIFLPFLLLGPRVSGGVGAVFLIVGLLGLQINVTLAAFNMLPVFPLDGSKVFRWNKLYWAAVFGPLAGVALYLIFFPVG